MSSSSRLRGRAKTKHVEREVTLVAQIMLSGAPFLIGDALLSSSDVSNPHVTALECELPLVGEINSLLSARGRPFRTQLCQKLHVFDGRLAVGWSGDQIQAERVLKVLREVTKRSNVTALDLEEELSAIDPDKIGDLSLVGHLLQAVKGDEIRAAVFHRNVVPKSVAGFGEVLAAGSGAQTFIKILQSGGPPSSSDSDISAGLPVLGALLNLQLSTGQSIDERWGGTFEAALFSQATGRVEKLDNVLHTFWMWRGDGKINFQPRFYFTRYFDGLLVLRSAEYETHEGSAQKPTIKRLKSNKVQLVPSVLRQATEDDRVKIGHVDFSYDYICCHVWFRSATGRSTPRAAVVLAAPRGSGMYDIDLSIEENGALRLNVPNNTVRSLIAVAGQTAATL